MNLRGPRTVVMGSIILALLAGTAIGVGRWHRSAATNNVVASSISPYSGTAYISNAWTWHGSGYGEDALDLFVPEYAQAWLDVYAQSQYLYWESSNYGLEGGASSLCTGKVYQIWYSNGGTWTAALLQNIVHLDPKATNTYGSANPYGHIFSSAGYVAETQDCDYDAYHFHDSRGLYWGNSARGSVYVALGAPVYSGDQILVGRD